MQWKTASVALTIATLASAPALAQPRIGRSVQMIAMGSTARTDAARPLASSPWANIDRSTTVTRAADASASFRVHDLSRRWVAFQMATNPVAPEDKPLGKEVSRIEPIYLTDSLAIPAWMRSGGAVAQAAPSYVPGCNSVAYRPTGFLKSDVESRRQSYFALMSAIACGYGIPVGLFDAMIIQESRYDPLALSSKGAFGLAQLMPATATMLGVNRLDVVDNLRGGASYLRSHLDRFGRYDLALAAYNAGPGRVQNGRVPAIAETQGYVSSILNYWQRVAAPVFHSDVAMTTSQRTGNRSVTGSIFR